MLDLDRPTASTGRRRRRRRAAAPRPVRRARLVVGGLSRWLLLGVFAARVLLGDYTITIPDFFRILGGDRDPGRALHPDGEQAAARGARRARRASRSGSAGRSSRPRCATRWPAPTSSASASAPARPPCSRSCSFDQRGAAVSVRGGRRRGRRRRCWSGWSPGRLAGNRLVLVGVGLAAALHVGDPVPLHPRRRVRRPAGAALAHRQPQPRRLADDPGAGRGCCWCCCPSGAGWPGRCGSPSSATTPPPGSGSPRGVPTRCSLLAVVLVAVGGRGRRPDRVRRVPRRADRPGAQRRPDHAGRRRPDRRRSIVVGGRLRRPTTCSPTSTSPSASSPAPSGRRSCSGCSPAAAPEGGSHDHPRRPTRPRPRDDRTGDAGRRGWSPTPSPWGTASAPVVASCPPRSPTARSPSIVGANACGKSTLLRGMARLLRPTVRRGAARRPGDPPAADPPGRPHPRPAAAEPGRARGRHRRRPGRPRPAPAPGRVPPLVARRTRPPWPRRSS